MKYGDSEIGIMLAHFILLVESKSLIDLQFEVVKIL